MSNNASVPSTPESGVAEIVDDAALKERELALKERELALREQEAKAKIELEKRGVWFSSPLLIGLASAIFGLAGTGIGAALQGHSNFQLERQKFDTNFQLERQKFEFSLIQKALDIKDRDEAAKQLMFLVGSGIIQSLDAEKIRELARQPSKLPVSSDIKVLRRQATPGCVITVTNSLVSLLSQPYTFSRQLIRVEPGDYKVTEQVITSLGKDEEGWFQIESQGREGWIEDDTWNIAEKNSACP
ncbi:hypothetical protein [Trichocoleus sp. FACHB-262]|uniref:hypothetical protein n=1 Tax=Trichocoleus sp. FACHB-262 TaxID=2692869 RepID=UPI001686E1E6|nr:hypothetical protein [Trichocoleus sp. FACHB-262]MBD2119319.1 hypothetical protein [Trichocoleus sp. FACHB-262]